MLFESQDDEIQKIDQDSITYISNICPFCNKTGRQIYITGFTTVGEADEGAGMVITKCTFCENTAIRVMSIDLDTNDFGLNEYNEKYREKRIIPSVTEQEFPEIIITEYPKFSKIYRQSEIAESNNLDLICGMGYRRALEFLITDFLKKTKPELKEELEKTNMPFHTKIDKLPNEIRSLPKVSSWIGNDETHVIKRNKNLNIQDMKAFILALVKYIEMKEQLRRSTEIMNRKK